jgi:Protein of unknown function (DUF3168)
MEEALRAYLLADTALTALLAGRIYWVQAPQGSVYPCIGMTRISGTRDMVMTGPSGLVESRIQFDCDATGDTPYTSSKTVARALRDRLSGFRGVQGGLVFDGCTLEAERDLFEDGTTTDKIFRTSLDFMIWHKET